jgi:hypothetical protein
MVEPTVVADLARLVMLSLVDDACAVRRFRSAENELGRRRSSL